MPISRYNYIEFDELYPKKGKICRKCGKKLSGRKTSWCSATCRTAAWEDISLRRGDNRAIRRALKSRDKEICARCGRDCAKVKRIFKYAGHSISYLVSGRWKYNLRPEYYMLRIFGFQPYTHTWEADHIVEIQDGGKHELDNLQTLCLPCHKAKTNELRKERRK